MTNIEHLLSYLISAKKEQMAEFLETMSGACPPGTWGLKCPEDSCTKCWERWMQEEREE